jgi:hypothetical protein
VALSFGSCSASTTKRAMARKCILPPKFGCLGTICRRWTTRADSRRPRMATREYQFFFGAICPYYSRQWYLLDTNVTYVHPLGKTRYYHKVTIISLCSSLPTKINLKSNSNATPLPPFPPFPSTNLTLHRLQHPPQPLHQHPSTPHGRKHNPKPAHPLTAATISTGQINPLRNQFALDVVRQVRCTVHFVFEVFLVRKMGIRRGEKDPACVADW